MPTTLDLRAYTPSGRASNLHHLGTGFAHHDWLNFPWHGNAHDILVIYHPLDDEVCRSAPDRARLWTLLERLREIQAERSATRRVGVGATGASMDELEARAQSIEVLGAALEGMDHYLARRGRRIQRKKALEERKGGDGACVIL